MIYLIQRSSVGMSYSDPVFIGIIVLLVLFFFFLLLMVRRTILGFREGYERGKQ